MNDNLREEPVQWRTAIPDYPPNEIASHALKQSSAHDAMKIWSTIPPDTTHGFSVTENKL